MLYYKIKPEADQKHKNPKIHDSNIYIANELYTENEVVKQNLNRDYMDKINISSRNTFFSFGARFQILD